MSILPTLCTYVGLPDSRIKSPGNLLHETNKSETIQQQISRLIKHYKTESKLTSNSLFLNSRQSPKRSQSYNGPSTTTHTFSEAVGGIFSQRKSEELFFIKSSQIDETFLLQKAINIFSLYGITLILETNQDDRQINSVLKHLIPEFGFFPQSLIQRLNLNKFVICNEEDLATLNRKYPSSTTAFFPVTLQTAEEVFKHLNKVMHDKIVMTQPKIVEEWNSFVGGEKMDFEEIFYAIMQNKNLAPLRSKIEKAKELLVKFFPKDLTFEWFTNRNKEKKRGFRVSFCEENESVIP